MAKIISIVSQQTPEVATYAPVAAGASSIGAGVPTKLNSTTTGVVIVMVDTDGTTSQKFTGIAKGVSTQTASVAGQVELWEPFPGIVYSGFATTATNADTAAEILAMKGRRVIFDLTSGDWTVDTAAGDGTSNCVVLLGTGNPTLSTVNFVYRDSGTYFNTAAA